MWSVFIKYLRAFLKFFACFLCFFAYFFVSSLSHLCFIFLKSAKRRSLMARLAQLFARCLIFIIRVKIDIRGEISNLNLSYQGSFFVSNHLSYLDGFVLGALFPVVYVTKMELKKWPLIGLMTEVSGTFFVDRDHKGCLLGAIQEIAETLKAGGNVLYFPEGTSSNGDRLLPFMPTFFEAPLAAGACVVPVSLVYQSVDKTPVAAVNRDKVYWYGDMTFINHFFNLLSCRSIEVIVKIHPCLESPDTEDNFTRRMQRKQICELAYKAIAKGYYEENRGVETDENYSCVSAEKAG